MKLELQISKLQGQVQAFKEIKQLLEEKRINISNDKGSYI